MTAISKHDIKQRVIKKVKSNETRVYTSQLPERNTLSKKRTEQNRSREEKSKVVILSDSITKRINMLKFNTELKHDSAVKRAFPGATTSHLIHYVNACLVEVKPTKIIICGGTNNLSKKNQNAREIVKEIVEIVEIWRHGGVKQIFVSLICRSAYQKEINEINKLLKYYAGIYKFVFIDNSGIIREEHLWKDRIHLNNKGIYLLAHNYASHLNRPSLLSFENIWN